MLITEGTGPLQNSSHLFLATFVWRFLAAPFSVKSYDAKLFISCFFSLSIKTYANFGTVCKSAVPMNFDTWLKSNHVGFSLLANRLYEGGEEAFCKVIVSSLRRVRTVLKLEIHTYILTTQDCRNRGGGHYPHYITITQGRRPWVCQGTPRFWQIS